ncbi:ATP-binding protein [Yinghuangia sp. YIM S10712]|uniref:ATP-binding protein n=1 Tax=Yinghuangia sp. YIM S10712 TaxID=3436930 RepID=UPI003F52C0A4
MAKLPKQLSTSNHTFVQQFSATARGARLARRLAAHQLEEWGLPYGVPVSDAVALVVAELANNAVLHGHVPGRQFELRLSYDSDESSIRVEVCDSHPGRPVSPPNAGTDAEGGRGLMLVAALATRWGVCAGATAGKVVFAEVAVPKNCR